MGSEARVLPRSPARLRWSCVDTAPDAFAEPGSIGKASLDWTPSTLPGTASAAVLAGAGEATARSTDYDACDWWWLGELEVPRPGPWTLVLDGIATVSDVWLDGAHVAHSDSMYRRVRVAGLTPGGHDIAIRVAALAPLLRQRRPRPRWRTALTGQQNLRWFRTSLVGRTAGRPRSVPVVGPWRTGHLEPEHGTRVELLKLVAGVEDSDGVLAVRLRITRDDDRPEDATLRVGGTQRVWSLGRRVETIVDRVRVPHPDLWWPRGYGDQPLLAVRLAVGDDEITLGRIGFRTVELLDPDDGPRLLVNGHAVFARGACWIDPDPLGHVPTAAERRSALETLARSGANMVRVSGDTWYQDEAFVDACDELGLMVWQDVMLARLDPPEDEDFLAALRDEVTQVLTPLQGHPSLMVVSGGSELAQQPTMLGLDEDRRRSIATHELLPTVVADVAPGVPYVTGSPSGGTLPTHNGAGVAHYFGVGAYLRPLADARRTGVRFAAECLAFAVPPEQEALDRWGVPAHSAGHAPEWKAAVPADPGAGWDFEDVRDHYVRELFGVDPAHVRATEPERYLELGRAAVAHAVVQTFTEWRRPGSGCSGGLVLSARDVDRGAGWGLLDVDGAPKAPLHAVSAAWAPVALLATDEGLDGLRLHLVNDGPTDLAATLAVDLYDVEGRALEHADRDVLVAARGGCSVWVDSVLGAFRDVAYAYRFGARTYDCLRATLSDASGEVLAEHVEPLGPLGARTPRDLRLAGRLVPEDDAWTLVLTTGLLALWVVPQLSGYDVPRRWFHLAPGVEVRLPLTLRDRANTEPPEGTVRALNSLRPTLLSRA